MVSPVKNTRKLEVSAVGGHISTRIGLFLSLLAFFAVVLAAHNAAVAQGDVNEAQAIREIERLGGRIVREHKEADGPVTVVISGTSGRRFGDGDIHLLAAVKNLTELNLRRTQVTDTGLKELGHSRACRKFA